MCSWLSSPQPLPSVPLWKLNELHIVLQASLTEFQSNCGKAFEAARKRNRPCFPPTFFFSVQFFFVFSPSLFRCLVAGCHFVTPGNTVIVHLSLCRLYSYCFAPSFFFPGVSGVIHFNASSFISKRGPSAASVDCQHKHKYHFLSCFFLSKIFSSFLYCVFFPLNGKDAFNPYGMTLMIAQHLPDSIPCPLFLLPFSSKAFVRKRQGGARKHVPPTPKAQMWVFDRARRFPPHCPS